MPPHACYGTIVRLVFYRITRTIPLQAVSPTPGHQARQTSGVGLGYRARSLRPFLPAPLRTVLGHFHGNTLSQSPCFPKLWPMVMNIH